VSDLQVLFIIVFLISQFDSNILVQQDMSRSVGPDRLTDSLPCPARSVSTVMWTHSVIRRRTTATGPHVCAGLALCWYRQSLSGVMLEKKALNLVRRNSRSDDVVESRLSSRIICSILNSQLLLDTPSSDLPATHPHQLSRVSAR
jgi:hypothetical protein